MVRQQTTRDRLWLQVLKAKVRKTPIGSLEEGGHRVVIAIVLEIANRRNGDIAGAHATRCHMCQ